MCAHTKNSNLCPCSTIGHVLQNCKHVLYENMSENTLFLELLFNASCGEGLKHWSNSL